MPDTPTLEDLPELMSLSEAAEAVRMSVGAIRMAVKSGDLPAFIPRGRDPMRAGRGQGYRIRREDLQKWYFRSL
jgi:excisionase family DNA binding protein